MNGIRERLKVFFGFFGCQKERKENHPAGGKSPGRTDDAEIRGIDLTNGEQEETREGEGEGDLEGRH
jgi:hypothetical protein